MRALLRWVRDGWLPSELARGADVFTPDVVLHCAAGDVHGVDALKALLFELRALQGAAGRFATEAEDDQLVATYALQGRHNRLLFGMEPTGELIELQGIVTMRTAGDRIAELWHTAVVTHLDLPDPPLSVEKAWARRWGLTTREAAVAELAMLGHGDKQIAAQLELAPSSVSKYLRGILRKAAVRSRAALAERAGVVRLG
jgi:DNA-binding CsgD family transcriptional regulator